MSIVLSFGIVGKPAVLSFGIAGKPAVLSFGIVSKSSDIRGELCHVDDSDDQSI